MYNRNIKIELEGTDITRAIDKDTFPEWFDESMKGDGYFQFEVKPLTFRMFTKETSVTPARADKLNIYDMDAGKYLLKGIIDEIQDDETDTPELTVYPQAILLKDTIIGDEVTLSSDETVKDFEFSNRHIRDTVADILNRVNAEHGTSLYTSTTAIPDATNTGRFYGSKLLTFGGFSFTQSILNFLGFDDEDYIRKSDGGRYTLIQRDGFFYNRRILKKGQWARLSLSYSGRLIKFNFGSIIIPPSDFNIPWIDSKTYAWRMGASLESIGEVSNEEGYGAVYRGLTASNVPKSKFERFAKEQGFHDNVKVLASFDYDDGNSYAVVEGNYKHKMAKYRMVISFETAFDDEYGGHYRDATGMEILRDIAVVANRWLFVDRNGLVYMLPREQSRGSVSYEARKTIEMSKKVRKEEDPNIRLSGYAEDGDGKVVSYGLKLREDEIDNILSTYRDLFTGEVTERTLTMYDTVDDDILKTVSWDYKPDVDSVGTVIGISHSFLEKLAKVRIEDGV